jgi:hypothetical protein
MKIRVRPVERQHGRVDDGDVAPLREVGRNINRVIRTALAANFEPELPPASEMLQMPSAKSGLTMTEKLWVALNGGVPLLETFSVKLFGEFACVTSGRNVLSNVAVLPLIK